MVLASVAEACRCPPCCAIETSSWNVEEVPFEGARSRGSRLKERGKFAESCDASSSVLGGPREVWRSRVLYTLLPRCLSANRISSRLYSLITRPAAWRSLRNWPRFSNGQRWVKVASRVSEMRWFLFVSSNDRNNLHLHLHQSTSTLLISSLLHPLFLRITVFPWYRLTIHWRACIEAHSFWGLFVCILLTLVLLKLWMKEQILLFCIFICLCQDKNESQVLELVLKVSLIISLLPVN